MTEDRNRYRFVHRDDPNRLWFEEHYFKIIPDRKLRVFFQLEKKYFFNNSYISPSVIIYLKDENLDIKTMVKRGLYDDVKVESVLDSLMEHLKYHIDKFNVLVKSETAIKKFSL